MLRGVSEEPFLGFMRDGEQGLTVIETEWVPRLSWILTYWCCTLSIGVLQKIVLLISGPQ